MIGAAGLTAFFISMFAGAQSPANSQIFGPACQEEVQRLCEGKTNYRELGECLRDHDADLSLQCKEELQRMVQAAKQAASRGGGALGAFGGANFLAPPAPMFLYEGHAVPGHGGGRSSPAMSENRASLYTPLTKSAKEMMTISAVTSDLHFARPLLLSSQKSIPRNLYRAEIGGQYLRFMPEKKTWGLRGSLGYSGDKVLDRSRDLTFSLSGHYSFPGSDNSNWALTVFFANNSPLGNYIPIPGFVYFYKTETFTGMFGLPFASMQWTPSYPWSLSLSLFGPILSSELSYGTIDRYQIFAKAGWSRQMFLLSDRVQQKDRLTVEDKKTVIGVRTPLFGRINSELQAGYIFGRHVYIGNGLFKKDGGSRDLDASLYLSWSLRLAF